MHITCDPMYCSQPPEALSLFVCGPAGALQNLPAKKPYSPSANFGTGSLALQIAKGRQAPMGPQASKEVSIRSSPGQKDLPGSPAASRSSFVQHLGRSDNLHRTRSKTSQRGSVSPIATRRSTRSASRPSEATASYNSASQELPQTPRSPSPVSQPGQRRRQEALLAHQEASAWRVRLAKETSDELKIDQVVPGHDDLLPSAEQHGSPYLTRIPEGLLPALITDLVEATSDRVAEAEEEEAQQHNLSEGSLPAKEPSDLTPEASCLPESAQLSPNASPASQVCCPCRADICPTAFPASPAFRFQHNGAWDVLKHDVGWGL